MFKRCGLAVAAGILGLLANRLLAEDSFVLERSETAATISRSEEKIAVCTWQDSKIFRPYLADVCAPGGIQVTRRHPPVAGQDATDHDTMHPGIWLAFGDLSGSDFWRNKGTVDGKVRELATDRVKCRLSFDFTYRDKEVNIARESRLVEIQSLGSGYLFTIDSTFMPGGDKPLVFGDQEEMGLGVRLATPLTVKGGGGTITNSGGGKNEKEVWGQTAVWCDYSAIVAGRRVGVLLMPHPKNFRPSWMHVRDYGLLVANPFGKSAFTGGEKSRVTVMPGEKLRLRFGVLAYSADVKFDPAQSYRDYVLLAGQ